MILTDTHTHLYLKAFDEDRHTVVKRAIDNGIRYMLLPNIDRHSADDLVRLSDSFPDHCFPMMGLHPTSVKADFKEELEMIFSWFRKRKFIAVGEIGIDLYWDTTFFEFQQHAFRTQVEFALEENLPIVIHSRDSFDSITEILEDYKGTGLKGVFHCFTGTPAQARKAVGLGFMLGIGGVITFKNSGLERVIQEIDLHHLLLETDSPYLAPVPYRGKRNESGYIPIILNKLSEIKQLAKEEIASATTYNAIELFKFTSHA